MTEGGFKPDAEFLRRRRARNWAILVVLAALVVLFYFISVARLLRT
ncbi:MAG: hypothetical protein RMK64_11665 [Rhodovarius sp.]|nr:hypothetical protein [Rhodovarius sp.]MCX7932753.1 hypothetical protein [Rhodovarius sp.]MDW8315620.1 hypothetical protein [Rhodovarius sp.]